MKRGIARLSAPAVVALLKSAATEGWLATAGLWGATKDA